MPLASLRSSASLGEIQRLQQLAAEARKGYQTLLFCPTGATPVKEGTTVAHRNAEKKHAVGVSIVRMREEQSPSGSECSSNMARGASLS
eukprot:m.188984 g.188984  ORF g.188984 m.188984 type:complete len:89 (-) comp14790_c0_seq3:7-273(-)